MLEVERKYRIENLDEFKKKLASYWPGKQETNIDQVLLRWLISFDLFTQGDAVMRNAQ